MSVPPLQYLRSHFVVICILYLDLFFIKTHSKKEERNEMETLI